MDLFDWQQWPEFFPVSFHTLPESMSIILNSEKIRIFSMPVKHLIPTIGLRFELKNTGKSIAYSCDTEPCDAVVRLGANVDFLIHEAAGEAKGHSSARQCGLDAAEAKAKDLLLIHYPAEADDEKLIQDAREVFGGQISLARDGMEIS